MDHKRINALIEKAIKEKNERDLERLKEEYSVYVEREKAKKKRENPYA